MLRDRGLHLGGPVDHRDRDLMTELGELDLGALAEAVVRGDQEQDLKAADRREAPVGLHTIDEIAGRVAVDDASRIAVKQ